jgi:predicted nucleotidyltransferase
VDLPTIEDVARRRGVDLVVQFGSTVSGTAHRGSDIDLAVLLRETSLGAGDHLELVADLQEVFPGRDVDVVLLNHADPLLLRQVTDHGVLRFGEPNRWANFRAYAFRRYQDHRRFLAMERAYVDRIAASARP